MVVAALKEVKKDNLTARGAGKISAEDHEVT
jgi:hypothetical protein